MLYNTSVDGAYICIRKNNLGCMFGKRLRHGMASVGREGMRQGVHVNVKALFKFICRA